MGSGLGLEFGFGFGFGLGFGLGFDLARGVHGARFWRAVHRQHGAAVEQRVPPAEHRVGVAAGGEPVAVVQPKVVLPRGYLVRVRVRVRVRARARVKSGVRACL